MLQMRSPGKVFQTIYGKLRKEWKTAFLSCFLTGLLVHMPVLLSDIPNHDGLDSMYFDQNMITSGRWFLSVACGVSSYYTLPWVIGLLGLVYLGCTAAVICEILEIRKNWAAAAAGGLLGVFPAIASTFAYVFTLDGYMMAVLLASLAVLFTKKRKKGFLPGAVCLAFSMGIYQGYLAFAITLSLFAILMLFAEDNTVFAGKILNALRYLYMGALGAVLYYGILQILLRIQGKELAGYQGIDGMVSGAASGPGFLSAIAGMYRDFISFTFRGNILFQNIFSGGACILLMLSGILGTVLLLRRRKSWKNPGIFVIMVTAAAALPAGANIILLISPEVTYHLLMRYQWVLYLIGALALAAAAEPERADPNGPGEAGPERADPNGPGEAEPERADPNGPAEAGPGRADPESGRRGILAGLWAEWGSCAGAFVMIFCFAVTDNIAYSNLQKRYEKTYAYCVRLLDRIEQTEGYYPGIPIAMIGVVGEEQYPSTDLTLQVTSNMIGMNGDSLLYRGDNYREFMKYYLGATLNILPAEAMEEMYYSEEYKSMETFPGKDSIRIIDGILYIKTENESRSD